MVWKKPMEAAVIIRALNSTFKIKSLKKLIIHY